MGKASRMLRSCIDLVKNVPMLMLCQGAHLANKKMDKQGKIKREKDAEGLVRAVQSENRSENRSTPESITELFSLTPEKELLSKHSTSFAEEQQKDSYLYAMYKFL